MIHSFTVYPSLSSIWISIIMFKIPISEPKNNKKISVVFDEGLQRICYNELEDLVETAKIFICFYKNQICWEQEQLTPDRLNNSNPGKLRLECFLWIRKEWVLANWEAI